jgi:hypothetical protein
MNEVDAVRLVQFVYLMTCMGLISGKYPNLVSTSFLGEVDKV